MDKKIMRDVLLQQNKERGNSYIPRNIEPKILKHDKTPFIIIISGIRRCGKSTLLWQLRQKNDGYYVNFDDERFMDFTVGDFASLQDVLIEIFGLKKRYYFDEIQNIKGWERFVRRLSDQQNKVYVTGSNASMLSRELGTHLTGRHLAFTLYPFSFKEFLVYDKFESYDSEPLIKNKFREYLSKGGFPEYHLTGVPDYLNLIYENIIYRDIVTRYNLTAEKALRETAHFAASNIGKEISFNKIRKLAGLSSATTVKEYFSYMQSSFLFFLISKYSPSLKKQVYNNKKAYMIDTALAGRVGFRHSDDFGRIMENAVFIELLRRGYEVFFHKGQNECDFLIRDRGRIISAIQVSYEPRKEREIAGLREAMENYKLKKGTILSFDDEEVIGKISIIPVWKWMLNF